MRILQSLIIGGCLAATSLYSAELHKDVTLQGILDLSALTNKGTVRSDLGSADAGNLTLGTLADARLSADVLLSTGSYSNPSWLALTWAKLTSTPTTLAGYGITDAQPLNATLTMLLNNTNGTLNDNLITANFASLGSTPLNATNLGSGTVASARLSANLAALADNTTTTLGLSHISIGSLAGLITDQATITVASGTAPYFTARDTSGGATGELEVVSNVAGNTLALKNLNDSAWSALTFRSSTGGEHGAIGLGGNSVAGGFAAYKRNLYLEATDANVEGWSPSVIVTQMTTYGGTKTLANNVRIVLGADDGVLSIVPRGLGTNLSTGDLENGALWRFDPDSAILYGTPQAALCGADQNHAVILRDGGNNKNDYYSYGGTTAAGLGHKFFTGGLKASQTMKLQIADDAVTVYEVLHLTPQATPGSATEGDVYANSSDHHLYFYNGSAWKQLDN